MSGRVFFLARIRPLSHPLKTELSIINFVCEFAARTVLYRTYEVIDRGTSGFMEVTSQEKAVLFFFSMTPPATARFPFIFSVSRSKAANSGSKFNASVAKKRGGS